MKRFLLYLSALFLSVTFANAQECEYVISPSTGTIVNTSGNVVSGTSKGCTWTSNSDSPTLTMNVTSEGSPVNKMYVMSNKKKHSLDANNNNKAVSYTVSVPEDCGYIITGYSMSYATYQTVTVTNEINNYNETLDGSGKMFASGLNIHSFTFTLSSSSSYGAIDVNENGFVVFLEQESSIPAVEYTVSAIAGVGGTVTINGGTEAVTTTGSVKLVAVPNYGYKFKNWTIGTNEVSTAAEYTATVDSDTEFVANFEKFASVDEWYAAIDKPTFGKAGNTTFVKAATLTGDVNVEATGIQAVAGQACVTNAIEVAAGAEFNLNITYQLNWGDLAIYQIDNDGATKEYGYYYGSWEPNGSTEKVAQNIADNGVSVTEVVDGACTATFPITINENHNPGDVIVVRAITGVINDATNSAFEKNIAEGGYVDFLFVVAEKEPVEDTSEWSTSYYSYQVAIPEGVNAYIVTAAASGYVTLTRFEGTIPANTAVILNNGEPKGEAVDVDFSTNLLKGTTVDTYIDEPAYVLSKVDGEVGFYKAEIMTDGTWLNNANKAYLPASAVPAAAQGVASFSFRFGEGTTGVEKVEIRNEKSEIYDLTGRKLKGENGNLKGIYIINGKKVLVK